MSTKFIITDGPSDHELVDALKYVHDPRHSFAVDLHGYWTEPANIRASLRVKVIGLMASSGNRGELFMQVMTDRKVMIGEYNARTRQGALLPGHFSLEAKK